MASDAVAVIREQSGRPAEPGKPFAIRRRALLPLLSVIVGLVVLAGLLTPVLLRRRRHAWAAFARKHGLTFRDRERPRVSGEVDGRPLHLEVMPGGSDEPVLGVQKVRMSLALRDAPTDVHVERAHGVIGAAHRAMEHDVVDTGDPDFDDEVLVQGPRTSTLRWLVPARRDVIRRLLDDAAAEGVGISDGAIYVEDRSLLGDLERLDSMLAMLRGAAAQLEAMEVRP